MAPPPAPSDHVISEFKDVFGMFCCSSSSHIISIKWHNLARTTGELEIGKKKGKLSSPESMDNSTYGYEIDIHAIYLSRDTSLV